MRLSSAVTALALLAAATASARPALPLPPALPDQYRNAPAGAGAVDALWWRQFGDAGLDRMVDMALAGNLDIAIAAARLEAAAAAVKAARGAKLPSLAASGTGGIQRLSVEDQQGKLTSRIPGFDRTVERYGLTGSAGWEIDLFGGLSAASRAALARRQAAAAGVAGARLTIAAEVSDAFITARGLQARLAVARERLATLDDLVRLVGAQVAQGLAPAVAADQIAAERAAAATAIPALEAGLEVQFNRLDVLMGRVPGSAGRDMGAGPIPAVPAVAAGDGPAALLASRPDIVAAQRQVAAADATVAEAIAAKYPRLTLSGFAGFLANGLTNLLTAGAVQLGAEAQISAPIFAGGRLRAQEAAAKARLREAVAAYRQTALQAVAEAEDSLSALTRQRLVAGQLAQAQQALLVAQTRTDTAWRAGSLSLVDDIAVRRRRQDADEQAIIARADAARSAVTAFRALGGGWRMG
ncbi:MAG: efflux transporter outer membrane subunit [Sphingomonadales bacterium]|jgi:NodT family efflux transporter outer membrane factor (OMF) lipoprotein